MFVETVLGERVGVENVRREIAALFIQTKLLDKSLVAGRVLQTSSRKNVHFSKKIKIGNVLRKLVFSKKNWILPENVSGS